MTHTFHKPHYPSALQIFIRSIQRYPLLTAVQERELGHIIYPALDLLKKPDSELTDLNLEQQAQLAAARIAAKKLFQSNLRLVIRIAVEYYHKAGSSACLLPLDLMDLIQEGTLGLEVASLRFDIQKNCKFGTLAYWWIRQAITRALSDKARTIRISIQTLEKMAKAKKLYAEAQAHQRRTGEPVQLEAIAQAVNVPLSRLEHALLMDRRVASIYSKTVDDGESRLIDLLQYSENDDAVGFTDQSLSEFMDILPPHLRQIIEVRYGLIDGEHKSFDQVAKQLNLTKATVRNWHLEALRKMRKRIRKS